MKTLSVSKANARLNELARIAHAQHEWFTLTRNGTPEAVLLSVDDLEGLETTLETLADAASVAAIAESLAERGSGVHPTDAASIRQQLRQRAAATG